MANNDGGMTELLELLKTQPELIGALVFDAKKVERLLKGEAARRLIVGVDVRTLLRSVSGRDGVAPLALCLQLTGLMVAPGPECPGSTKTLPTCPGMTKGLITCPGNTKTVAG